MSDPANATADNSGTFDDLPLHPTLRRGVNDLGYRNPTPIQRQTIPDAIRGRDLIGTAQTGSGKTAAFLLPILERLLSGPTGRIRALVLTPTRELALQAQSFLDSLGKHTRLRGGTVYGGVGFADQERWLRGGAEIIIATPGRLLDHMGRGYVDLSSVEILVLDEADRMLDMGFLPDVRRILERLPRQRQTLLFSATMPPEIVRLARDFQRDPKTVNVDPTTAAAVGVSHLALPVPHHLKAPLLRELLEDPTMTSVLVFCRTKHRADRLAAQLERWNVDVSVIHGDRSQSQRVRALEGFREGRHRVLVATDIAARGIDVEAVSHVVNFDLPTEPEAYIHRVGRTARAQKIGDAYTLVAPDESDDFDRIEQLLGLKIPRTRLPGFNYDSPAPSSPGRDAGRHRGPMHRGGHSNHNQDQGRNHNPSVPRSGGQRPGTVRRRVSTW